MNKQQIKKVLKVSSVDCNEIDICRFVNQNKIKQEDIQQITVDKMIYTIFYWEYIKNE